MARLDMSHGFLRYITKNQMNRDLYEKESSENSSPKTAAKVKTEKKVRREARAIYTPPFRGANKAAAPTDSAEGESNKQFDVDTDNISHHTKADISFRDEHGNTHKFRVNVTDDPKEVSREFCEKMRYPEEYVRPLADRIVEECSQYFHFRTAADSDSDSSALNP